MNEYTCDQCHRTHNRSRKCLYCGAVSRYQKPTAAKITPKPSPAVKVRIVATQLELPIPPSHDEQMDAMHEMDAWQAMEATP